MKEYAKGDIVRLKIEDMGIHGEGIGKTDGFTVFVKDTVIGDEITAKIMKARKNYGYGRLIEVLEPSPARTEPRCPVARQCGGCQLQMMKYEEQLRFKAGKVRGDLERIGGFHDLPMEEIIGMDDPFRYRNKAQFPVGKDKNGRIITGFYAGHTHSIIENRDCVIGQVVNRDILDIIVDHMNRYGIEPYDENNGSGTVRHILIRCGYHTGEIMVCLILNGRKIPHEAELTEQLRKIPGMTSISININTKRTNVILGDEIRTVYGPPFIVDRIGNVSYQISPLSFYQVNPVQTEKLYRKVLEYADLSGDEIVWDLYCGTGTISLFLAGNARFVRGVEIIPQAIENARQNALRNHFSNTEFFVGRAEEILPAQYEKTKEHADVIVVDPPRKGCDEVLLKTMIKMQPDKIVYVSCDSATLARDLKYLCGNGYTLRKVCPVDQFCQTVHVEVVSLLQKMSNTRERTITLDVEMEDYHRIKNRTEVTADATE